MKALIIPEMTNVMESSYYRPAVSIILPFDVKMGVKAEVTDRLKYAVDKVRKELGQLYKEEISNLILQKLNLIIKGLNFNTFKKSIAIYVSPVFEKVLYLDIPVEEKIIINESFEIRDLIYAKKELHKYLVLVISAKWSKVYLGNGSSFSNIQMNTPDNIGAFKNDIPERVSNFSDPAYRKEVLLKKFLNHTDKSLHQLLKSYPIPVFVMGPQKVMGYFKALTKNEKSIVGYVHGNYEEASEEELHNVLGPHIAHWKTVQMEDLRHQMERAADAGKLASGIRNVWQKASEHKGRLLIVEKNFMYAAQHGGDEEIIFKAVEPYNKFSYIKDAVDDIIEKVLEDGGDVEFVDEGLLKDYNRIALIQYY